MRSRSSVDKRAFSTNHIDYIQRNFLPERIVGDANTLFCGVRNYNDIRLLHVQGISRFWQESEEKALATRQLIADIYSGLHAERIPTVFMVLGTLNRINVFMGSFRDSEVAWAWPLSRGGVHGDLATIKGSLMSALPGISLRECSQEDWLQIYQAIRSANGHSVLVGTPTAKIGTEMLGIEQIERLIRGMYGCHWGYLVIAKPFPLTASVNLYNQTLNEMREVINAQTATATNPIAEAYENLLKRLGQRYDLGKSTGLWRISAYCFGADPFSFLRVRAVATAVFGGAESLPDPIRTIDCMQYSKEIAHLGQIVLPCSANAPGGIVYEYEFANMLSSAELATLAHLPQEEMPGYSVKSYARFSVSPALSTVTDDSTRINLGEIVDRDRATGNEYKILPSSLTQHSLIAGVTGSGKTNTVFQILREVWHTGVPFLVIEPAKNEYRELLDEKLSGSVAGRLRVFTLGDERVSPFRLNPFQILPGVPLQTHIDYLKAVFNASFAMYGPMPHVLEQCILGIYQDRGWDMITGLNSRGEHPMAFPTLTDLYHKIDDIVGKLGYGPRITPELKAALQVRVNSLRVGGKGLMLDTPLSIPIATLLEEPTVLELQPVGDDDEKAFVMGLLWIFIYEYYRTQPALSQPKLRHVSVIEEAHRLLTGVPPSVNSEIANTRGKAVEAFSHMLAEIRAYGESVIIAEQIPTKLSPDAIKNTSLKIMHRLVSEEDRVIMGGAMNMDEHQLKYMSGLKKGFAAVYAEGDDTPSLVYVPHVKDGESSTTTEMISESQQEGIIRIGVDEDDLTGSIKLMEDDLEIKVGSSTEGDISIKIGAREDDVEIAIVEEENNTVSIQDDAVDETSSPPTSDVMKSEEVEEREESPTVVVEVDIMTTGVARPVSIGGSELLGESDRQVKRQMHGFRRTPELKEVFSPSLTTCPVCEGPCPHRAPAFRIASEPAVQESFTKFVLSLMVADERILEKIDDIIDAARRTEAFSDDDTTVHRLAFRILANDHLRRIGARYAWSYDSVQEVQISLVKILETELENFASSESIVLSPDLASVQNAYRELFVRKFVPYPQCHRVCDHGLCQFRHHLAAFIPNRRLHQHFLSAINDGGDGKIQPLLLENGFRHVSRLASRRILYEVVPESAKRRAGTCFLIQKAFQLADADELLSHRIADLAVRAMFGDA